MLMLIKKYTCLNIHKGNFTCPVSLIVLVWLAEDVVIHHTQNFWLFQSLILVSDFLNGGIDSYNYNSSYNYQFPLYVFGPQLILIAAGGGNFSSAPLANIGPTE